MLFTNRQRSDEGPMRADETDFNFLDRSSDQPIGRIRDLLETFAANYPPEHFPELRQRIRDRDGHQFSPAVFELCLHEYLLRQKMKLTLHPELPNGSAKRPDFLVECPDGRKLYVEAKSPPQSSSAERAAAARKNVVLTALNSMLHPNFIIAIDSRGSPATPPPARSLIREVKAWLDGLDADFLLIPENIKKVPPFYWVYEEWRLRILPMPVVKERRGASHPSIGMQFSMRPKIDRSAPIRKAVSEKTTYYGDLDLPLVVAASFDGFRFSEADEVHALFGDLSKTGLRKDTGADSTQHMNLSWAGLDRRQGARGSGAWIFSNLRPDTIARSRDLLYLNPLAKHAVPDSFLTMSNAAILDSRIGRTEGIGFAEAFKLPFEWPVVD